MNYDIAETSTDDGRPFELYWFSYSGREWRYTNSSRPFVWNGATFMPIPITSTAVKSTGDVNKATVTIRCMGDTPIGELYRVQPPSEPVIATIYGRHIDSDDIVVNWKGRITTCEWVDVELLELHSESVFTSLMRPGLARTYQVQCPYALYGAACGANAVLKTDKVTVSAVNGVKILTPTSKEVNWYAGGYLTYNNPNGGNVERRMIRSSLANGEITLAAVALGLSAGMEIEMLAGCDHTLQTCDTKFTNSRRYGGMPWIPIKNPFGGSTVY